MTIYESYKLAEVIQKLRSEKRLSLGSTIEIAKFLEQHTPAGFSALHWKNAVNKKELFGFEYYRIRSEYLKNLR